MRRNLNISSAAKGLLLLAICFLRCPSYAEAGNYTITYKMGSVDWSNGMIEAKGVGFPPDTSDSLAQARSLARSSALKEAQMSLLSVIGQLPLTSGQSVRDYMMIHGSLRKDLTALCKKAQLVDIFYGDNGSVVATLSLKLYGAFSERVLPRDIRVIPSIAQEPRNQKKNGADTGILFDCRGLKKSPLLVPRVFDEDGVEVYGPTYASRENAVNFGMGVWFKDITKAGNNWRAGPNPLVIKAIGAAETNPPGSIRISNADAEKIRGKAANVALMHSCRVIFVLD